MVRLMLASIVGAIGYLLLYAGVAEGGTYALRPWDALGVSSSGALGPSFYIPGSGWTSDKAAYDAWLAKVKAQHGG